MTASGAQPQKSISLQAISGAIGALAGIVVSIFGAGVYYEHLRAQLDEYVK